jgi:hypothetical protein
MMVMMERPKMQVIIPNTVTPPPKLVEVELEESDIPFI